MVNRRFTMLVFAALAGAATVAALCGYVWRAAPDSSCGLVVSDESLDIGTIWWQRDFKWTLPIANRTDHDIEIVRFQRSCECVRIEPEALTIPAGTTKNATLVLDLSPPMDPDETERGASARAPRYRWRYSASIVPELGGTIPSPTWTVHGHVQVAWTASPATIDFGDELTAGAAPPPQSARVLCEHPVPRLEATCDARMGTVDVKKGDDRGLNYVLQVSLHANLPAGRHDFPIDIRGVGPDGRPVGGLPIVVKARVRGPVEAVPDTLSFGLRLLGETASAELVVRATTANDFTVAAVRTDSVDLRVRELHETQTARSERLFRVTQNIAKTGNQSHKIVFLLKPAGTQEAHELTVPVVYLGISDVSRAGG